MSPASGTAFVVVFEIALAASALAQTNCSEATDPMDAGVEVIRCADGVVIVAESSALRSSAAQLAAHPGVIQLDAGALVVALTVSGEPIPFRVLTPDAVISASEGQWAVVAEAGRTDAATWRGDVIVRRRVDDLAITLKPGEPTLAAFRADRIERLREAMLRALTR